MNAGIENEKENTMSKFTNMKIGRKLGLVLTACVVLLVGMAGLAIWGNKTMAGYEEISRQRITKAWLAEQVAGGASAATTYVEDMVFAKKVNAEEQGELVEVRKTYLAASAKFKELADTPKSKQHAADMEAMIQEWIAANTRILDLVAAGKQAEASRELHDKSMPMSKALRAKAAEAQQWQVEKLRESEQQREAAASSTMLVQISGSIVAVILAIFGGLILTRSIVKPLAAAVSHLDDVARGDVSARYRETRPGARGRDRPVVESHAGHVRQPSRSLEGHHQGDSRALFLVD